MSEKKKYLQKCIQYSQKLKILKEKLNNIYELEASATSIQDFDDLTNLFGTFYANIFSLDSIVNPPFESTDPMTMIFFQIGKWIYIMDALDDYYSDKRKHKFNLINLLIDSFQNEDIVSSKTEIINTIYIIHLQILAKINEARSQLSCKLDPCVENIISFGMTKVFWSIKEKEYKECEVNQNVTKNIMEYVGE